MLNPEFLTQLEQFRIRCIQPFRGKFRGDRRSLNRGTGVEFSDYRLYEHGDDLRYLDWNIYARSEKLFIKLFQTDEELPISILIDTSQSMQFGQPTKLDYAKHLAASLGYISLVNSDRVVLYSLAERLYQVLPSTYGKSQFPRFQKALTTIESSGTTRLTESFKHLATYQPQAGVVIILSDFLDSEGYTEGINALLGRRFALMLIHIQCIEETDPPPIGDWQMEDAETGETKQITINEETITQYRNRQIEFCENLQRFCTRKGVGYIRISTDTAVDTVVMKEMPRAGFIERRY
ncbi:MAG: DUF58 domain-containing protein [Candidatus Poribacteria bacterium]|nr:DUF58 domain-containing protein [Candidatus Poribacteria bacterium]